MLFFTFNDCQIDDHKWKISPEMNMNSQCIVMTALHTESKSQSLSSEEKLPKDFRNACSPHPSAVIQ